MTATRERVTMTEILIRARQHGEGMESWNQVQYRLYLDGPRRHAEELLPLLNRGAEEEGCYAEIGEQVTVERATRERK